MFGQIGSVKKTEVICRLVHTITLTKLMITLLFRSVDLLYQIHSL